MTARMTAMLMQGDAACAEGAIAAGCRFFAGYPITPATEVAEVLARRLPQALAHRSRRGDEHILVGPCAVQLRFHIGVLRHVRRPAARGGARPPVRRL